MKRSINSLIGYNMEGINSDFGVVEAFYVEDKTWSIRYLILETGNRLSERKVLLSPDALASNYWKSGAFPKLGKDKLQDCPEEKAGVLVSGEQESESKDHYAAKNYLKPGIYATGVWSIIESSAVMDKKPINEEYARPGIQIMN